jgi:hypothetical protein
LFREEFGAAEGENPRLEPLRARLARLGRTKPRGCAGVGHNRRDRAILKKLDHQWLRERLERALLAPNYARQGLVTDHCPTFARSGGGLNVVAPPRFRTAISAARNSWKAPEIWPPTMP